MPKLSLPLPDKHPLRRWADAVRDYYGSPVFLVGSQLTDKLEPRDIDVTCVIPDQEFRRRYGSVRAWIDEGDTGMWTSIRWNWAKDCVNRWEAGCAETGLNLDFKVIPQTHHDQAYLGKRMYQLDTRGIYT